MMSSTQSVVGSIVSLWRYPVKSMMGEELNASEVTRGGLLEIVFTHRHSDERSQTAKNSAEVAAAFNFARQTDALATGVKDVTGSHHPARWHHRA